MLWPTLISSCCLACSVHNVHGEVIIDLLFAGLGPRVLPILIENINCKLRHSGFSHVNIQVRLFKCQRGSRVIRCVFIAELPGLKLECLGVVRVSHDLINWIPGILSLSLHYVLISQIE